VLSFLYGMTGRRDMTEDLLQETVSRAFILLPNLREESKFSTWLFGIARNVARERSRSKLRNDDPVDPEMPSADAISDPRPDPETDAIKRQLYRAISKGFAVLDEDRRTALALRVLAEKQYREIAEITGWSLARVKIEIHRARLEMRKMMEPYLGM
jgi:RNA polymerase sigma-70 factor (ECF subfamily)